MNKILLTNIQRFSLHDGPGIRTTVFLKGCSLRCPWCANPENYVAKIEKYNKNGENGEYGKYMTCDEIYNEVVKDKIFYDEDGGVTFSGGEALLQIEKLVPLMERLKEERIHMAVETCLFVPQEKVRIAANYIDLFYADVKILDKNKCKEVEGGQLDLYLSNLQVLFDSTKYIILRLPVIGRYTDDAENRGKVVELLKEYRPLKVEIIKGHNLGAEKRKSIGLDAYNYIEVNDSVLDEYKKQIEDIGIEAEICKI